MTEDGDTDTIPELLLVKVTVTPPAGAAEGRVTAKAVDFPRPTLTFEGNESMPALCTCTEAVALDTPGVLALAVTRAVPTPVPVTCIDALVAPAWIVTEAGMLITPDGLAVRLTTKAEGAPTGRLRVRF